MVGIIDQPVLQERWLGVQGQHTTLNGTARATTHVSRTQMVICVAVHSTLLPAGSVIHTRACKDVGQAYMYSTSPFQFMGDNKVAYERLMHQVDGACFLLAQTYMCFLIGGHSLVWLRLLCVWVAVGWLLRPGG